MDLSTEHQPKEPRRGVPPFAEGIERKIDEATRSDTIKSKSIPFRSVGNVQLSLYRPTDEEGLAEEVDEEDMAFTLDLSGNLIRGKARDLIKQGYYLVMAFIDYPNAPDYSLTMNQDLQVNLWINNTDSIVSSEFLEGFDKTTERAFFTKNFLRSDEGETEHFVLPNNPTILQALRMNVATEGVT